MRKVLHWRLRKQPERTEYPMIDPLRARPTPESCYEDGETCNGSEHPGWRHAASFQEIEEWLANDLDVIDEDADKVTSVDSERKVFYVEGGGGEYHYQPSQVLIEDVQLAPPPSAEEEDEVLRSIMETYNKNRLSGH